MDVVIEHNKRTKASGSRTRGNPNGGQKIGRSIGAGRNRTAHRTCDDDRDIACHDTVEHEGGFLDRVGALRDDDAIGALTCRVLDCSRERFEVREGKVGAR